MAAYSVNTVSRKGFTMLLPILLVICVTLLPTNGSSESIEHGISSFDDKEILNLIKRIQSSNNLETPDTDNTNGCLAPNIERGSIIRATESINAGAEFINSFKDVGSNAECHGLCCHNKTCDVAVYQAKKERYCYLFRCQNKCLFNKHDNYLVNRIVRRPQSPPASQPEAALQNLNQAADSQDETTAARPVPQSLPGGLTAGTVDHQQEDAIVITPHTVGLGGYCTANNHCEDPNAACITGTCHCKGDYYSKNGLCRKVCPSDHFECVELGTQSRGPDCVPQAQLCDSYLQCADGSDEFNCDSPQAFPSSGSDGVGSKSNILNHKTSGKSASSPKAPKVPPSGNKGKPHFVKPTSPKSSPTHAPKITTVRNPAWVGKGGKPSTSTKTTTTRKPASNRGNDSVFMSREKVIIASTNTDAEGPIIALSLGLAFTLILLVLVGCRMRNMRTRLRKGRPLHQNEADYLINGMYL